MSERHAPRGRPHSAKRQSARSEIPEGPSSHGGKAGYTAERQVVRSGASAGKGMGSGGYTSARDKQHVYGSVVGRRQYK